MYIYVWSDVCEGTDSPYVNMYVNIYIYIYIYIYICMYIYVWSDVCEGTTSPYVYMYIYTYIYIYTYACKYMYMHIYMYIHIYRYYLSPPPRREPHNRLPPLSLYNGSDRTSASRPRMLEVLFFFLYFFSFIFLRPAQDVRCDTSARFFPQFFSRGPGLYDNVRVCVRGVVT